MFIVKIAKCLILFFSTLCCTLLLNAQQTADKNAGNNDAKTATGSAIKAPPPLAAGPMQDAGKTLQTAEPATEAPSPHNKADDLKKAALPKPAVLMIDDNDVVNPGTAENARTINGTAQMPKQATPAASTVQPVKPKQVLLKSEGN